MMKRISYFFLLAIAACKDPDEASPLIDRISVNGQEEGHMFGTAGAVTTFHVELSDDHQLNQVKCELVTPGTFHSHEAGDGDIQAFRSPNLGVWDTLAVHNVNGTDIAEDFSFLVPDTITGGWSVQIAVLDENGNLTTDNYTFHIQNDSLPGFYIGNPVPGPDASGVVHVPLGETLTLSGVIFDADTLQYVNVVLKKGSTVTWSQDWNPLNAWNFDVAQVAIPPIMAVGTYTLTLSAGDVGGWETWRQATIKVE